MSVGSVQNGSEAKTDTAPKRVLIVSRHNSSRYSGGRYHAWIMTEAFAAGGADVVVWTTEQPFLLRDFKDYPDHDRISLHIDPYFSTPPQGSFDAVILAPDQAVDWSPYVAAVSIARSQGAPFVLLDFEAPKWFNAENAGRRSIFRTASVWFSARYADVILSSTAYGSEHAREYYKPQKPANAFRYCYPSVNSIVADRVTADRADQIICIARITPASQHKGVTSLLDVFTDDLAGYSFVIIGTMPKENEDRLRRAAEAHGINFVVKWGLTDHEKFEEIKRSRLMVFLSTFEGFGYPPVEALYCGVPCIVNPLPVLREVSGDAPIYLKDASDNLSEVVKEALDRTEPLVSPADRDRIWSRVNFDSYVERLAKLLSDLESPEFTPVAARTRGGIDFGIFVLVGRITRWLYRCVRRSESST